METVQRSLGSYVSTFHAVFKQGESSSTNKLTVVALTLLNVVLLVAAIVIGVNCAKVKDGSIHVSHSAAVQLLTELEFLSSNHSDVIEAAEEAKKVLETAVNNHTKIKMQIMQQKNISDGLQTQLETLRAERTKLQSNISALEGTCGKCIPGWLLLNSSCYFFSYLESATVKKNWHDSRADCIRRGADLVVINNPDEQIFVSRNIDNMKIGRHVWDHGFWVGLTDAEHEGTWVWINNVTETESRYWMEGEPNDIGRDGEDCGVAVYSSFNPWKTRFDAGCKRNEQHWICETASR